MAYATEANIIDLYGAELLDMLADKSGDGVRDAAAIARALDDAASLIDGYLSQRYTLPLPAVPAFLRTMCIDITLYRLASNPALLSEDARRRYDDALRFLRDIAAGRASLGLPAGADGAASEAAGAQVVIIESAGRVFSRDKLRSL
jgi:phage gp36-like protein